VPEFDQEQLRKWAVSGAEQRLVEIAAEAAAIYQAFPELRRGGRQASGGGRARAASRTATSAPRAQRNLSPAARKRISDAQKRRWAAHRKGGGSASR